jgi:hypothetical protein
MVVGEDAEEGEAVASLHRIRHLLVAVDGEANQSD